MKKTFSSPIVGRGQSFWKIRLLPYDLLLFFSIHFYSFRECHFKTLINHLLRFGWSVIIQFGKCNNIIKSYPYFFIFIFQHLSPWTHFASCTERSTNVGKVFFNINRFYQNWGKLICLIIQLPMEFLIVLILKFVLKESQKDLLLRDYLCQL